MAPRVGPRGVTIGEVARVANSGSRALPMRIPPAMGRFERPQNPPQIPIDDIVAQIIGGRSSGYGIKYAGLPSEGQFRDLILGQAYQVPEFAAILQARADEAKANLAGYQEMQSNTYRPGSLAARELEAMSEATAGRLSDEPAVRAAMNRLASINAQQRINETLPQMWLIGGEPSGQQILGGMSASNREDLRLARNATGVSTPLDEASIDLARQQAQRDYEQAMYAAHMERMNAVTPLAPIDYTDAQRAERVLSPTGRQIATSRVQPQIVSNITQDVERNVLPYEQLASGLAQMPIYELARKIAMENYGVPQALAYGMFTPEVDVNYGETQKDYENYLLGQQGIDFSMTDAERVYRTYGPDKYQEYSDLLAAGAIEKASAPLLTAEDAATDNEIAQTIGVATSEAAGAFETSLARAYLLDPNFATVIAQGRQQIAESGLATADEKKNFASQFAFNYEQRTGDPVAARILLNALLSFDFLYTDQ